MDNKDDDILIKKKAEIESLVDEVWTLYDVDADGKLSKDEAKDLFNDLSKVIGAASNEIENETIFNEIDEDHDGRLSKTEFKNILLRL